ncbi:MAG TPA: AAA family ATPase [Candidatus Saccharimonadales bacterium]|nr:AAA family ATPase [Candidatus Saccharimonadales bacterium]
MHDLLINNFTKQTLQNIAKDPPHALLFAGPLGVGKLTLAKAWAKSLNAFAEVVEPEEKGSITIETVRSLYRKTSGKQAERQVIIIDHAETMGVEAQNAFLKLLEEPRQNVTFILTAISAQQLLATINSRLQTVSVNPVSPNDLKKLIAKKSPKLSPQETAQILFIAQGRPAILNRILADNTVLEQYKNIMQSAKKLISETQYDRLATVNDLVKDKGTLIATLEAMITMTAMQITKSPNERWFKLADSLEECLQSLLQNGNPRAQLVNFFLSY